MLSTDSYRFGLIGYPISHSQSPSLFDKLCDGWWKYDLIEFKDFEEAFKAFAEGPYKAVNVTAPFKTLAAERADSRSPEVQSIGAANILVKTSSGIAAYNSDYLAVKELLIGFRAKSVSVIGLGGAGRAAAAAADELGLPLHCYHHDEIEIGVTDDVIIYTLPGSVPGCDNLTCRVLLEANYKDPCLCGHSGYVSGLEWLRSQARLGFALMTGVDPGIIEWIASSVLPRYDAFDKGHQRDHARYVIDTAIQLSQYYDVNYDMIAVAAACHDLGLSVDRKTHHLESGNIIRKLPELSRWFSPEQIEIIAQAAEDHRASSKEAPRTIFGKIIAEADRQIIPEVVIRRTIQFGFKNYPEIDREGHWQRTVEHLNEKYAEGGYLKLWIPESPNAARLEELREIIRDKEKLRKIFDSIFDEQL